MLMNVPTKPLRFQAALRISAIALFAGASALALHAQQATVEPSPLVADVTVAKPSLAAVTGITYSSSASDVAMPENAVDADRLNLSTAASAGLQPPPRRRYGRPRYNDSSHNPDGSNKYAFVVGGGFTGPVGNTYHYLNTNYAFQVGGGRNFNKNFGVLLQFDYDRFGFNGRTLYNQLSLYNYGVSTNSPYYLPQLDGSTHVWAFSLNPTYSFYQGETAGAYIVGGVGFYHKVANFTTPVQGQGYDYYYGPYTYTANETIDHYTSNAPGFSGGIGLTYKPSRFAGERLFAEARYVFVDNSQRYGYTVQNVATTHYNGFNAFPANSNRTTYTDYKVGIRF